MKAFAYINPTNEKDAVAALSTQIEQSMPIGGGQDLLARMKDYVTQPDRIVNVKVALESTVTPLNGGLRIGAAMCTVRAFSVAAGAPQLHAPADVSIAERAYVTEASSGAFAASVAAQKKVATSMRSMAEADRRGPMRSTRSSTRSSAP